MQQDVHQTVAMSKLDISNSKGMLLTTWTRQLQHALHGGMNQACRTRRNLAYRQHDDMHVDQAVLRN